VPLGVADTTLTAATNEGVCRYVGRYDRRRQKWIIVARYARKGRSGLKRPDGLATCPSERRQNHRQHRETQAAKRQGQHPNLHKNWGSICVDNLRLATRAASLTDRRRRDSGAHVSEQQRQIQNFLHSRNNRTLPGILCKWLTCYAALAKRGRPFLLHCHSPAAWRREALFLLGSAAAGFASASATPLP
jgi:hypothetical protein